ncbi:hypothetical protein [Singulisphaera sp. PoT]|uniref:hypothetical protein n=1 Tax=Singulisphaera sp. PoT TaxID=3411797 RepID=UPI003BF52C43
MSQTRIPLEFDNVLLTDREGRSFSASVSQGPNPSDPEMRIHVLAVVGAAVNYSSGFRYSATGGANTWRWPS